MIFCIIVTYNPQHEEINFLLGCCIMLGIHAGYMLTFANWFISTPVASVETLSIPIPHQLEAVVTFIMSSRPRFVASLVNTAVFWIVKVRAPYNL